MFLLFLIFVSYKDPSKKIVHSAALQLAVPYTRTAPGCMGEQQTISLRPAQAKSSAVGDFSTTIHLSFE